MTSPSDPMIEEFFTVGVRLAMAKRFNEAPQKIALLANRYATLRKSIFALETAAQPKKVVAPKNPNAVALIRAVRRNAVKTLSPSERNAAALIKAVIRSMPPRPDEKPVPNVREWLHSIDKRAKPFPGVIQLLSNRP